MDKVFYDFLQLLCNNSRQTHLFGAKITAAYSASKHTPLDWGQEQWRPNTVWRWFMEFSEGLTPLALLLMWC